MPLIKKSSSIRFLKPLNNPAPPPGSVLSASRGSCSVAFLQGMKAEVWTWPHPRLRNSNHADLSGEKPLKTQTHSFLSARRKP